MEIVPKKEDVERIENVEDEILVGQWYWLKDNKKEYSNDPDKYEDGPVVASFEKSSLCCVTEIGTNYVELSYAGSKYSSSTRIHTDIFSQVTKLEKDHSQHIESKVQYHKSNSERILNQIKDISANLGMSQQKKIEQNTRSLAILNAQVDVNKYKNQLIETKDHLPKLFEELKESNEQITYWMQSAILQFSGLAGKVDEMVENIKDKVFNITLYSGLTEQVEQVSDGEPAPIDTKLTVMQRKLYMDEECLANYTHGGLEFKSIHKFDKWVIKKSNIDRIFPTQRCLVAFQVRRSKKDRGECHNISTALIHIQLEQQDKLTYFYIRNGQKVYRINTDVDFDSKIFPNMTEFSHQERLMVYTSGGNVREIMTKREYDVLIEKDKIIKQNHKKWVKENKDKDNFHEFLSPYRDNHRMYDLCNFEPFDSKNLYFDEITGHISDQIKKYNRIALIIQGLFDRSEVLHPHHPAKLWTADGFDQAVNLVYDFDNTLHTGEKPDFESFRRKCNATLKTGSVTVGQYELWGKNEAEKENKRRANSWRRGDDHELVTFHHYGDPGPGVVTTIDKFRPGVRECIYEWQRDRLTYDKYDNKPPTVRNVLKVSANEIFNIDGYKLGDYKIFFQDPRTRQEYFKWAPLLLIAEEYHAGNIGLSGKDGKLRFLNKMKEKEEND